MCGHVIFVTCRVKFSVCPKMHYSLLHIILHNVMLVIDDTLCIHCFYAIKMGCHWCCTLMAWANPRCTVNRYFDKFMWQTNRKGRTVQWKEKRAQPAVHHQISSLRLVTNSLVIKHLWRHLWVKTINKQIQWA